MKIVVTYNTIIFVKLIMNHQKLWMKVVNESYLIELYIDTIVNI